MTLDTSRDEQIVNKITSHLAEKFKVRLNDSVDQYTDLFQEGLIDSFGFVELVAFLEKAFGIQFEESEFTTSSLNSVANIVATVKRKMSS